MSKNLIEFKIQLPENFKIPNDSVGQRIFKEYGALFAAKGGAVPPEKVIFKNEEEVSAFQSKLSRSAAFIGGYQIELQSAAMLKLSEAIAEARRNELTITPRGADSGKRNYAETVELWSSRVKPGLNYWIEKGKLSEFEGEKIRLLSPFDQVSEVFKLEAKGLYFSKDLSKSIVYSVAPPGTSQHLSMLAFDINEHGNLNVREILADHGWFQTVISDLPHFTFLGIRENELFDSGLKKVLNGNRRFWVPDWQDNN